MTADSVDAAFIESEGGRIFVLLRRPAAPQAASRCVLFVPPFAEEMNKCRRQMTEAAKAVVAGGSAALIVDLYGTGDSEGDFADATWTSWKANVAAAVRWAGRLGLRIDALVAVRLGCVLAAQSLHEAGVEVDTSVFWQPVPSGRQFLMQFLRLRVAASMMEADRQETVEELRAKLARGETLAVAGYSLSAELAQAIERAELPASLHAGLGSLRVVEVGRGRNGEQLTPAGRRLLEAAEQKGIESSGSRVPGEPFWSSTEIVVNAELCSLTAELVPAVA